MHRSRTPLRWTLLIALAWTPASVRPQEAGRGWSRRTIEQDQGLPETQVQAIAQTPDGYLWLGTRRGLVRYDGDNFTLFTPDDDPGIPAFWINGITVDARGRLWLATERGIAVREGGRFRRVADSQVPHRNAWKVFEAGDALIVATSSGAFRGDGERFTPLTPEQPYLYSVVRDGAGRIWVGGRDYLAQWDGRSLRRVRPVGWPGDLEVLDMVAADRGDVWAATRSGVVRFGVSVDGTVRVMDQVSAAVGGVPSAVLSLGMSPGGLLWIGSSAHGVLTWDGARLARADGGGSHQVWAFHHDARGRMWVGTGAGLERYQRSAFTTFSDLGRTRSTWSIRGDPAGYHWVATGAGEVFRFQNERYAPVLPAPRRSLSPGTWPAPGGGVYVAREHRRILQVTAGGVRDLTARYALNGGDVLGLFRDSRGRMWFSTDSGVFRSDGGRASPVGEALGLPAGAVPRDIREDASGRLLFGRPGLTVVDGMRHTAYGPEEGLTDANVLTLHPEGENVWIGTADSGLFVLRKDRIVGLGHLDPRLHREVLGIAEDLNGHLWLSSSFGLTRVARADLVAAADGRATQVKLRSFDRRDGLATTEFNGDYQGAIHRDATGKLWFPSYLGVVRVDPAAIQADSMPPQVHVESVVVDGREVPIDSISALPPHVARLEVTFAVTDAVEPSRVRVQYRMEGIGQDWLEAGARRTLAFGPLRGGPYLLTIRAANEEGDWGRVDARLDIRVARALYEEPWFIPLLVVTSAALVLLVVRARQRRLVRRGEALAGEVRARTADLEAARMSLERRVEERTAQLAGELAERKRLEHQLLEAQKLESIGRLAGGVAHEINNSMTGVLGFTQLAMHTAREQPALLGDLHEVRRAGERVAGITKQLLAFARRQVSHRTVVDVGALIERLSVGLERMAGESVRIVRDVPVGLPAACVDATQLEQVLINLVLNARDAMPRGGTVTIGLRQESLAAPRSVGSVELPRGTHLHITVADEGNGMTPEVLARLFEPFFTTKDPHQGTGLGLAVCHGIIAQHGGAITAESTAGHGSTFHVWLPAVDADVSVDGGAPASDAPTGDETILVVEDEPAVREVARRSLTRLGYRVIEAGNGLEALAVLEIHGEHVALVLSDVVMPQIDGLALAQAIRSSGRETPIIFMSGYSGHERDMEILSTMGPLLAKPFTHDALALIVRQVLDREPDEALAPGRLPTDVVGGGLATPGHGDPTNG